MGRAPVTASDRFGPPRGRRARVPAPPAVGGHPRECVSRVRPYLATNCTPSVRCRPLSASFGRRTLPQKGRHTVSHARDRTGVALRLLSLLFARVRVRSTPRCWVQSIRNGTYPIRGRAPAAATLPPGAKGRPRTWPINGDRGPPRRRSSPRASAARRSPRTRRPPAGHPRATGRCARPARRARRIARSGRRARSSPRSLRFRIPRPKRSAGHPPLHRESARGRVRLRFT